MSRWVSLALWSVCAALSTLTVVPVALAVDRHWNVGTGLWTQSADWSPSGVPQTADNAILDFFNNGGGTAQLATSNVSSINSATVTTDGVLSMVGAFTAGSLLINNGLVLGSSNMSGTLNVLAANPLQVYTGGMTVSGPIKLGVDSGAGTVNQNAGTVNVIQHSSGGVTLGGYVDLGYSHLNGSSFNGSGVYNLSGGLLSADAVSIGGSDRTTGTFNLSGSGTTNLPGFGEAYGMFVGDYGIGVVNQSGGTNQTAGLIIGFDFRNSGSPPAGSDVYTMTGGSLSVPVGGFTIVQTNGLFNYKGGQVYLGNLDLESGGRVIVGAEGLVCSSLYFDVSPEGVLDLKDHSMLTGGSVSQRDALKAALASGYNNGAWTGAGINSSVANFYSADVHRTAVGMAPTSGGGYQLKYTYYGDANLDGAVDTLDFNILAANFGGSSKFWNQGDFNYDGSVDTADFNFLASNFSQTLPSAPSLGINVPEPGMAWLPVALLGWSRRKRKRCARGT